MDSKTLQSLTEAVTGGAPVTAQTFRGARHEAIKSIKESVFPLFKESDAYVDATKALR
jgi:hypothetical protein